MDRWFCGKNRQVLFIIDNCPSHGKIDNPRAIALEFLPAKTTAVLLPMDQGIIETTRKLYRKALLQRMLTAHDTGKRYNVDFCGTMHLPNFTWKELAPSKVANCFAHTYFSCTVVGNSDNDHADDDCTCSDMYEAVRKIAGREVEGDFETLALAYTAAPMITPATSAEIIDTAVGDLDEDKEPTEEEPREVPTIAQMQEHLRLLLNKVE